MKIRRLKVYCGYHGTSTKKRPYIRLCGDYLDKMDFKIGDHVEIVMEPNCIYISKVQKEQNQA
jgi:hypothetical protein